MSYNVVDDAIERAGGSPGDVASRLCKAMKRDDISRQQVMGWRERGEFPEGVAEHAEKIFRLPKPIALRLPKDVSAMVDKIARISGEEPVSVVRMLLAIESIKLEKGGKAAPK